MPIRKAHAGLIEQRGIFNMCQLYQVEWGTRRSLPKRANGYVTLERGTSPTRFLDDGTFPIDNSQVLNLIRSWALRRTNWLFAGSLRSGQRASTIMSLIQSAKLNGHEPYAYVKEVLEWLVTQKVARSTISCPRTGSKKRLITGKRCSPSFQKWGEEEAIPLITRG